MVTKNYGIFHKKYSCMNAVASYTIKTKQFPYGKTFTLSDWSILLINKYSQVTKRQYRRFAANKYNYCLSLMNCIDYINNMAGVF
jgi:hypothetical protein